MPVSPPRRRPVRGPILAVALALSTGGATSTALGQDPTAPDPDPTTASPAAVGAPAGQLAEQLRKMEEMNQKLLRQVESVSKQYESIARENAALSKTVLDLSKRLDDSLKSGQPARTGTGTGGTGGGDPPGDGAGAEGDSSAPYVADDASRPRRSAGTGGRGASTTSGDANRPDAGGATGGRDTSAPYLADDASRPSRANASPAGGQPKPIALNSQYDPQRYGYLFRSDSGEFELRVNSLLQVDGRIYQQRGQNPVSSDFDIPRARLYFSGRMTRPIEYQISIQRSNNNFDLLNAYVNLHYDDRLQVRFGRMKAPYTFEWYKMTTMEMFAPERSLFALNFGLNRMVGVQAWGFLFDERLEYAVGVFDGPRNSYQDYNSGKDLIAFLDYKPFWTVPDSPLKNFSVGGSVDDGRQNNPPVPSVLRTSVNAASSGVTTVPGDSLVSVPFLAFNNNVRERGQRELWELHSVFFYRGLSLLGAWESGRDDFSQTAATSRPVHLPVSGFFVQAAYLLTGEKREKASLIDPLHPFDLRRGKRGLGAIEVQARFSELLLGKQVFTGGLADPTLWSNRADMIDAGLNWYLNRYTKFYFDWEHAVFGQPVYYRPGPGLQKTSDLFWMRFMLYF